MIALERVACAVDPEAVGLDGEPAVRPPEVELASVVIVVDLGTREVVVEAELEEQRLEIAARHRRRSVVVEIGEERDERRRARAAGMGGEDAEHRSVVVDLQLLGAFDGAS